VELIYGGKCSLEYGGKYVHRMRTSNYKFFNCGKCGHGRWIVIYGVGMLFKFCAEYGITYGNNIFTWRFCSHMSSVKEKNTKRSSGDGTVYANRICDVRFVKGLQGSFSVEAAFILPMVLMCLFLPIQVGLEMHQDIKTRAVNIQQNDVVDVISGMYRKEWMENFLEGLSEENEG